MLPDPRRIAAVVLPLVLSTSPARAIERAPLSEYLGDVWQTESGLPQNAVQAVVQTRDGFIWLGTTAGLVRFDGLRFTTFDRGELKVNNVHALLEDREGRLWIGTYGGGLSVYEQGRFRAFGPEDGLGSAFVRSLFEDRDGRLWVATHEGGVSIREGTRFRTLRTSDGLANDTVRVVYQAPDGRIWIGTNGGGLNCWDAGRLHAYGVKPGSLSAYAPSDALADDNVLALWQDPAGTLWVGTDAGGLWRLSRGRFSAFLTRRELGINGVRQLLHDTLGALWIGTDGGGLYRLQGGRFEMFTSHDGLPSDIVLALLEDREHNIWVGTRDGLVRLKRRKFMAVGAAEGLGNEFVTALCGARAGGLWVGTRAGLDRVEDNRASAIPFRSRLPVDTVLSLLEDRTGTLWLGTRNGLWRVRHDAVVTFGHADGLPSDYVSALAESGSGDVWVGTRRGIARVRGDDVKTIPGPGEGLGGITTLHEAADGSLWVGTDGSGLARWHHGRWAVYGTRDGLAHPAVTALHDDGDSLWIGTLGGLSRLRNGRLRSYTLADGLPADHLAAVLEDGRGSLWLSSFTGIARVEKRSFDDRDAGRVARLAATTYGKTDGMRSSECNGVGQPAAWRDGRGRLWFPTVKGLAVVDPDRIPSNPQPPPVILEEVRVDNEPVAPEAHAVLPPGRKHFEFHYTALSYFAPEKVRFRYKLEGFDPDWIEAGARRVAFYTNIPPGGYRFRVIAGNEDGVWNEKGASRDFALRAHFYRRPLFWAAVLVAAAALVLGLHRLRLRQVKAEFAAVLTERNRIAREIHDTLAQGFVGISVQLETVAKMQAVSAELAKQHLDRARILVRSSLAEARRGVWALRSQALEDEDLPGALNRVAQQLSGDHEIVVHVSGRRRRLPAEVENNLLRIAQEALANAVRHANADGISVAVHFGEGRIRLSVRDDGCGFDVERVSQAAPGHFGLAGIRERVHNIGGELSLLSGAGQGTEVMVEVPVA
jgi:ligand-binding sensor domain-containing protein/signal transduction histidine kinase